MGVGMADASDQGDLAHGIDLARQGRKEAAYASLRRALFSDGDSALLRSWLAAVAPTPGESIQHLERALELEPGNSQVMASLDAARRQVGAENAPPGSPRIVPPAFPSEPVAPPPGGGSPGAGAPAGADLPMPWTAAPGMEPGAEPAASPAPPPVEPVRPHSVGEVMGAAGISVRRPVLGGAAPAAEGTAGPWVPAEGGAASSRPRRPPPDRPARNRMLPVLLGLIAVLLLIGVVSFMSLNTGTLAGGAPGTAAPAHTATATPNAAATAATTATAGALAVATQTGVAQATIAVESADYRHAATQLMQDIRSQDGDIGNTIHQLDSGVLAPLDAAPMVAQYTRDQGAFAMRARNLDSPVVYRQHQGQVMDALDVRGQAVEIAADYVSKLRELADAGEASRQADAAYDAAAAVYAQNNSQENFVASVRAKQLRDDARNQVERLRTYVDQDQQKFQALWAQYNNQMPDMPAMP
jgi:hypothetical protein